jgi:hypothetical protein
MATWGEIATRVIAETVSNLPANTDYKATKKAIEDAYPFGERSAWPYDAWCKARKEYLSRQFPFEWAEEYGKRRDAHKKNDPPSAQCSLF